MNKNIVSALFFAVSSFFLYGQQIPLFTQTSASSFLYNPAIAGTKQILDFRMGYRSQWTGLEGAPQTEYASVNARLLYGSMGLGGFVYQDQTGPTSRTDYTGAYAFHLRFPDVELSLGISGSMMQYTINGPKITVQTPGDVAVDQNAAKTILAPDASAGFYIYNDRFHFGFSALNLLDSKINTYPVNVVIVDGSTLTPHLFMSFGYNFSGNPDYVWENDAFAFSFKASPILVGYSLRVFCKKTFIIGTAIRFYDAVAFQVGYIFANNTFNICYSYDVATSDLRYYNNGSQEVTLIYSIGARKKAKRGNDVFQQQKYGYMF